MNIDKIQYNIDDATVDQTDYTVIQQKHGKRIDILTANATGSNAADLKWYVVGGNDKTTVNTAALINATSLLVDVDDNGADLNGTIISTSDFCVVELDTGGYQLFTIGSVSADAGNDRNTLGVTPFGGTTGLDAAVAADNRVYIVRAANVSLVDIGNASVSLENPASGRRNHPLAITMGESGGGTTHRVNGVAQYVA